MSPISAASKKPASPSSLPTSKTIPIPAEDLSVLCRGGLKRYLTERSDDDEFVQNVGEFWRALLATMRGLSTGDRHLTAVCNTISVFLQVAASSAVPAVREVLLSKQNWMATFEAILLNFEGGKLKPLRQVLATLIKLLGSFELAVARAIEVEVLLRVVNVVFLGKPRPLLKASMVVMEAFMRSSIPLSRILSIIGQCHGSDGGEWVRLIKNRGINAASVGSSTELDVLTDSISRFIFSIGLIIADSEAQATAGTFLISFLSLLEDYHLLQSLTWMECFLTILHSIPEAMEPFKNYLLVPIFRLHPDDYQDLLQRLRTTSDDPFLLEAILVVLIAAWNAGISSRQELFRHFESLLKPSKRCKSNELSWIEEPDQLSRLLAHSSRGIRIRTFELLTLAVEPTSTASLGIYWSLLHNFSSLYGDTDPKYRGEAESVTQSMLSQIGRAAALQNSNFINASQLSQGNRYVAHGLQEFVDSWIKFFMAELGPNCSFPRHISGLRGLSLVLRSGLFSRLFSSLLAAALETGVFYRTPKPWLFDNPHYISVFFNLLLNPFEDVRTGAGRILRHGLQENDSLLKKYMMGHSQPCSSSEGQDEESYQHHGAQSEHRVSVRPIDVLLDDANKLSIASSRADHSDGVGNMLHFESYLLRSIKRESRISKTLKELTSSSSHGICLPTTGFSIHALLSGIRYVVEDTGLAITTSGLAVADIDVTVSELIALSKGIWKAVRKDLCVDSPEFSHDDEAEDSFDGPKDFLAYSWRAVRDSNLLIQSILRRIQLDEGEVPSAVDRLNLLKEIYALCFQQLTELRHRGAFSTVAQTFALCCEKLARYSSMKAGLEGYRQAAFRILEDQSSQLTRRSAGLPAVVAGLLFPTTPEELNRAITTLTEIARADSPARETVSEQHDLRLPQVHALNCLREVLSNARFREQTKSWIIDVLTLAVSSLSSQIWAVRNCGLMLFRTCAGRLGAPLSAQSTENEIMCSNRHDAVFKIAMGLLDIPDGDCLDSPELIFAGLDLLSRTFLAPDQELQAREAMFSQLGSHIWMIREQAARVYASRIPNGQRMEATLRLTSSLDLGDQNRYHGFLLCCDQLLDEQTLLTATDHEEYFRRLIDMMKYQGSIVQQAAPIIQALFMTTVQKWSAAWPDSGMLPLLEQLSALAYHEYKRSANTREKLDNQGTLSGPSALYMASSLNIFLYTRAGRQISASGLMSRFRNLAARDPDSARMVLECLPIRTSNQNLAGNLMVDFFLSIVRGDYSTDIAIASLLGMSRCLDSMLEVGENLVPQQILKGIEYDLRRVLHKGGRDAFTASIRVLGSFLAHISKEDRSLSSSLLTLWIKLLQEAVNNLTDAPVRTEAIRSLFSFRHCLAGYDKLRPVKEAITLLFIVHDLSNDDDEELRHLAGELITVIRSGSSLCPAAARSYLMLLMARSFSGRPDFHCAVLARLILPQSVETRHCHGPDDFRRMMDDYGVQEQLQNAMNVSHALFEEEKQNLYVDEVEEIDVWYSVAYCFQPALMDQSLRDAVGDWTMEGVRALMAVLPELGDGGPYGSSWRSDVLAVIMRVLRSVQILIKWDDHAEDLKGRQLKSLLPAMQNHFRTGLYPPKAKKALEELCDTVRSRYYGED